jgi:hypothetical protein
MRKFYTLIRPICFIVTYIALGAIIAIGLIAALK